MRIRWINCLVVGLSCSLPGLVTAQFNVLGTTHGQTDPTITQGVTIGNIGVVPVPTQAFQVRGELLGTGSTPEVFRTNAPTTANTYWRMFQGGLAGQYERGQLFAEPAKDDFNMNSPNGHLLFHTINVRRARINGKLTTPMGPGNPFPNITRDGFMVLSGQADAFVNPVNRAPFSRLHLIARRPNYSILSLCARAWLPALAAQWYNLHR